ncbi:MAG: rhomboid family intramembrane serine protease [Hyphomicrobiales bacterium]
MILLRIDGEERALGDEEFEIRLRRGEIPPHALVKREGEPWVRADSLETFWRLAPRTQRGRVRGVLGLRDVLFPRRGFSATELLLFANVLVFAALAMAWGPGYLPRLAHVSASWWYEVRGNHAYWLWLPTLFLHAGGGHLVRNMIALLATAGAVEFLIGGRAAVLVYLITGLAGAIVSYVGHGAPPLSVGASGAVFGLLGCTASFVLRRRRIFNYAQRWKVWRVYVPLFLLLSLPSIVNADVHAHAGGFVAGLLMGIWLPPHPRVPALAAEDPFREDAAGSSGPQEPAAT